MKHENRINGLALSNDDKILACGTSGSKIYIWDLITNIKVLYLYFIYILIYLD